MIGWAEPGHSWLRINRTSSRRTSQVIEDGASQLYRIAVFGQPIRHPGVPQDPQCLRLDAIDRLEQICKGVGPEPGHGGLHGKGYTPNISPVSRSADLGKHARVSSAMMSR